jgi:hypothetical protein
MNVKAFWYFSVELFPYIDMGPHGIAAASAFYRNVAEVISILVRFLIEFDTVNLNNVWLFHNGSFRCTVYRCLEIF